MTISILFYKFKYKWIQFNQKLPTFYYKHGVNKGIANITPLYNSIQHFVYLCSSGGGYVTWLLRKYKCLLVRTDYPPPPTPPFLLGLLLLLYLPLSTHSFHHFITISSNKRLQTSQSDEEKKRVLRRDVTIMNYISDRAGDNATRTAKTSPSKLALEIMPNMCSP